MVRRAEGGKGKKKKLDQERGEESTTSFAGGGHARGVAQGKVKKEADEMESRVRITNQKKHTTRWKKKEKV